MEKSIETIWKQGFIESDALIAPKVNNLYNQKSKTIIDRLKRTMRVNLYFILVIATMSLVWYTMLGLPYVGIFIFILFISVYWLSIKQARTMKNIDVSMNSYDYLKSLHTSVKNAISNNSKVMRFFYPLIFLASLMPIMHELKSGEATSATISNSEFYLIYGIPTFVWIISIVLAILMYVFGGRIYQWDVNLMYGRIFKKLEIMIAEMEKLQN